MSTPCGGVAGIEKLALSAYGGAHLSGPFSHGEAHGSGSSALGRRRSPSVWLAWASFLRAPARRSQSQAAAPGVLPVPVSRGFFHMCLGGCS